MNWTERSAWIYKDASPVGADAVMALAFAAGFVTGVVTLAVALWVLRRELALYRRARGETLDFTATSKERR